MASMSSPVAFLLPKQREVQFPWSPPPDSVEVLWRCEARSYSYVIDADTDTYGSTAPVLEMHWHPVKRWTRTGARLENGKLVFLQKGVTNRQWASRTPAEALVSFTERRKRQVRILKRQLEYAQYQVQIAENVVFKEENTHG